MMTASLLSEVFRLHHDMICLMNEKELSDKLCPEDEGDY